MRIVETELSGILDEEELPNFGGAYTFFEKLKMGGTGSPKVIYESGIPAFDDLVRGAENESTFVGFEVMKNGLIVRANRQLRMQCVGTRLTDIDKINLEAFKIELRYQRLGRHVYRTILRGELEIRERDGNCSQFQVLSQNFQGVLAFFQKKELSSFLDYWISDAEPEKDYFNFRNF